MKIDLLQRSGSSLDSLEFSLGDVVHGQVVHVGLDELQGVVLHYPHGLGVQLPSEFGHLLPRDSLAVFRYFECLLEDILHLGHSLDALTHAEAEVAEPLVV